MIDTERVWRCPFNALPLLLRIKFLVEENAYLRWEERMRDGIVGTACDDWRWAEQYVHLTWPHVVIQGLFRPSMEAFAADDAHPALDNHLTTVSAPHGIDAHFEKGWSMTIYFLDDIKKIGSEYTCAGCYFPPWLVLAVDHENNALCTIPAEVTWVPMAVRLEYSKFTVCIPRNKVVHIAR